MKKDQIFEELGLTQQEVRVYQALLAEGPRTATKVATGLGVPRSTVYGFLSGLMKKGLVTQVSDEGVKIWQPKPPSELLSLLDQKVHVLESSRGELHSIVSELEKNHAVDFVKPQFQYFEGSDAAAHALKEMLLYDDIETQSFFPINDMVAILGEEFFHYHNVRRIKQNISVQALWPEKKIVDIKKYPFSDMEKALKEKYGFHQKKSIVQ